MATVELKNINKIYRDNSIIKGVDMSFTSENTPTPSVSNFIPSTIFDFAFKGKYENPYLEVKKRLSENADVIESEIITMLA